VRTTSITSIKILPVRPVAGLFTGAWIAKAITLGEHLLGARYVPVV
jgi:hypothetical protein